jgi:hypothetical protein
MSKKHTEPKEKEEKEKVRHVEVEELPAEGSSLEEAQPEEKKEEPEVTEEVKEMPSEESLPEDTEPKDQELSPATEKPLEEVPPKKAGKKSFMMGFLTATFVFGLGISIFYLVNRLNKQTTDEPAQVAGTSVAPTPTPAPTQLTREEITLEILNGSGVSGAAGEAATTFEDLGYEVSKVGNAEETEGNQLYVNPDVEDLVDVLLEDVKDELDISSVSGELDDSTASARIILGK